MANFILITRKSLSISASPIKETYPAPCLSRSQRSIIWSLVTILLCWHPASSQPLRLNNGELLSSGPNGRADGGCDNPSVPLNGRYVAFQSTASNLTTILDGSSFDTSPTNIFTRSLTNPEITRISFKWYYQCLTFGGSRSCEYVALNPDGSSYSPAISPVSPEGRYVVAFESTTQNFLAGSASLPETPSSVRQLFMYDPNWKFQQDRIKAVSMNLSTPCTAGEDIRSRLGNGSSTHPSVAISPGEAHIAFATDATNLVAGDSNNATDILITTVPYLADATPTATPVPGSDVRCFDYSRTIRVTTRADGTEANSSSDQPIISGDGTRVAYRSTAANLQEQAAPGANPFAATQIYLYNTATRSSELISADKNGAAGNGPSYQPHLSYTGNKVAFITAATNIGPSTTSSTPRVILYDARSRRWEQGNTSSRGEPSNGEALFATLSPDGRLLVFSDTGSNIVDGDANGVADVFLKHLPSGKVWRVSRSPVGAGPDGPSLVPIVNLDSYNSLGGFVTFASEATNLTADASSGRQIFRVPFSVSPERFDEVTVLEVPADVAVDGTSLNVEMQRLGAPSKGKLAIRSTTGKTTGRLSYRVELRNETSRRLISRQNTRRNTIAMRGLPAGTYSIRYQVQINRGPKTIAKSPFSPRQLARVG